MEAAEMKVASEEVKILHRENKTEEMKVEETVVSETDLLRINFHILYLSGVKGRL
jgi:hypothetical protein